MKKLITITIAIILMAEPLVIARPQKRPKQSLFALRPLASAVGEENKESLGDYVQDPTLGRHLDVAVVVKNNILEKLTRRSIFKFLKDPLFSRPLGRHKARAYREGFVLATSLSIEALEEDVAYWKMPATEPHDVDFSGDRMLIAGANMVRLYDRRNSIVREYSDPYFGYVHTVEFSQDGRSFLIASAGFDAVFEIDIETGDVIWEWHAWDHGYDYSALGYYLTRSKERASALKEQGRKIILVDDPAKWAGIGIPTAQLPAMINGARYLNDQHVLITLFQSGKAIIIDKESGQAREVFSGLLSPHGFKPYNKGEYLLTDTRKGLFLLIDSKFHAAKEISIKEMPIIPRKGLLIPGWLQKRLSLEWLQNVSYLGEDLYAAADMRRSAIWLINIKEKTYRKIDIPSSWSVQDIVLLGKHWINAKVAPQTNHFIQMRDSMLVMASAA